jgi:hypothetical protein
MKKMNHAESIAVRYGLLTCLGLIAFFLLMRIFNLAQNQELRVLNMVILTGGIIMAVSKLKQTEGNAMEYLNGISCAMLTALVGVGSFAVFVCVYLLIDTQLLNILQQTSIVGKYINPFSGAAVVFMEGIFSAAIISLGVMQYLKTSKLQQIEDDEKRYKTVIPQASPQ